MNKPLSWHIRAFTDENKALQKAAHKQVAMYAASNGITQEIALYELVGYAYESWLASQNKQEKK